MGTTRIKIPPRWCRHRDILYGFLSLDEAEAIVRADYSDDRVVDIHAYFGGSRGVGKTSTIAAAVVVRYREKLKLMRDREQFEKEAREEPAPEPAVAEPSRRRVAAAGHESPSPVPEPVSTGGWRPRGRTDEPRPAPTPQAPPTTASSPWVRKKRRPALTGGIEILNRNPEVPPAARPNGNWPSRPRKSNGTTSVKPAMPERSRSAVPASQPRAATAPPSERVAVPRPSVAPPTRPVVAEPRPAAPPSKPAAPSVQAGRPAAERRPPVANRPASAEGERKAVPRPEPTHRPPAPAGRDRKAAAVPAPSPRPTASAGSASNRVPDGASSPRGTDATRATAAGPAPQRGEANQTVRITIPDPPAVRPRLPESHVRASSPRPTVPPDSGDDRTTTGDNAGRPGDGDVRGKPASAALAEKVRRRLTGSSLGDLHQIISPEEKRRFVRELFQNREKPFRDFLNLLNYTPSWEVASQLIEKYFEERGLDPYSRGALAFSTKVYIRYFPKDIAIHKGRPIRFK